MSRLARRFLFLLFAIVATLAIGTVGFTWIAGYPPFDAFYMARTTMTTVGYAEIHPLNHAGRVFNSFLIVFGVTTLFIAIGAMTQTIIELDFGDVIGRRRSKHMIDKLKDHYIVCGYGRVGRGAAAELQNAGVPLVVVDSNPEHLSGPWLRACLQWRVIQRATRPGGTSASSGRAGWWRRSPPTLITSSFCSRPKGSTRKYASQPERP